MVVTKIDTFEMMKCKHLGRGVSSCHILVDRKNKPKNSKSLFYSFYGLLIFKLRIFCIIQSLWKPKKDTFDA